MYENKRPHLVVVAVSELSVQEVCMETFKYPWVCLIEKPVGINLSQAVDIATRSKELGRIDFVALNRRHYASTVGALEKIKSSDLKRIIHVCDQEDLYAAKRSHYSPLVLNNWMYANSIHLIDYFSIFARGDVTDINIICPWKAEKPDFVLAKIDFSSGDMGIYEAYWNMPGPWSVSITTSSERLELKPLEKLSIQTFGSRISEIHKPKSTWDQDFKPGLRAQAQALIDSYKTKINLLPTLDDSLATMRLVNRIYEV